MKEATIVQQALRILEERLPASWKKRILPAKGRTASDGAFEITAPDGAKTCLVVEAKASLFPRDVDALKNRAQADFVGDRLIVARFLTPSTRRRLRDSNLNYLDLTGNVR